MPKTYFELTTSHLRVAALALDEPDDACIGEAAYLTQQAMEKCLKAVYECHGKTARYTHGIDVLLRNLPQGQTCFSSEDLEVLEDWAERFTTWESKTWYPSDYLPMHRHVETGYKMVQLVLEKVSQYTVLNKKKNSAATATVKKLELFEKKD